MSERGECLLGDYLRLLVGVGAPVMGEDYVDKLLLLRATCQYLP